MSRTKVGLDVVTLKGDHERRHLVLFLINDSSELSLAVHLTYLWCMEYALK